VLIINALRSVQAVELLAGNILPSLTFLTGWWERVLGSGILRQQIAMMLARVVVVLMEGVVGSCRFDLWGGEEDGGRGGGISIDCGVKYRQDGVSPQPQPQPQSQPQPQPQQKVVVNENDDSDADTDTDTDTDFDEENENPPFNL